MKPPADIMEGKGSPASAARLQNRGPGKSSLSLQELQELAEKQKQQIYLNNKELLAKQQKLLELQQYGFRNKPRASPSVSAPEPDSYAAKLRETYQNHLERLREMQVVHDDTDAQRFSNIELSVELDRVRDMFFAKQRELASAVAKVETLTKQLEERRSGVTTWNITPEKMRRRRKIQAAREELDKLRNEMTIRNELNNQQSHQLKRQKEILREKQRELNELDAQIHLLGKQLKQYQTKGQPDQTGYKPINGDSLHRGNFSPAMLYDSLQRKRIVSKPIGGLNFPDFQQYEPSQSPGLPDVNGNVYQQAAGMRDSMSRPVGPMESLNRRKVENGSIRRGSPVPCTRRGNLYVAPDGREFEKPPTWDDFLGIVRQSESSRMFSPTPPSQAEPSAVGGVVLQPPLSPNLPRGRTDVKPALQVNGLDSPNSSVGGSPKTQKPAFRDSPLSGHTARRDLFGARVNDSLKPFTNDNSISPSSSVSSLSSMSSNLTNDDIRPNLASSKEVRDIVPPVASYFTRPDRVSLTSPAPAQVYTSVSKQSQDVWNDTTEFRALESSSPIPPSPLTLSPVPPPPPTALPQPGVLLPFAGSSSIYLDVSLSDSLDTIRSRSFKFVDSTRSTAREVINYLYLHKAVDMFSNAVADQAAQGDSAVPPQGNGQIDVMTTSASDISLASSVQEVVTNNKGKPQVAPKPTRLPPPPPAPKPVAETIESVSDDKVPLEKRSVKDLVEKFGGQESEPLPISQLDGALNGTKIEHGIDINGDDAANSIPPACDETDNIAPPDFVKEFPPPPPYMPKVPDHNPPPYSEIENYEHSFADIDVISATQNDLLPFLLNSSRSQYLNDSQDSTYDSDSSSQQSDEKVIVPVVISVPPEKMPPPILMKPGKDRRPKRNVQLDPHALLLDASLEGELGIVKQILSKVPDPSLANAEGITALHNAVCGNHKDVVKFLVEIGCDINSADNNGWTPLHCAAFYNDTELCKYLVEHGASVYATTYSDCQTPSQKCSRLEDNYDQCFQYLHECKDHVGKHNNGRVYALYDYSSESEDELSFTCGELLTVLRRGDGVEKDWWWSENSRGEAGYAPFNLLGLHPRVAAEV